MRRVPHFFCFSLLAFSGIAAVAQQLTFQTPTTTNPSGAPVLNKPYTAHKQMHEERTLADGTKTTAEFELLEARDASGVTASVLHQISGAAQGQLSTFEVHFVFSPAARTMLQWNNLNQAAQIVHLPPTPVRLTPNEGPKPEQLGH